MNARRLILSAVFLIAAACDSPSDTNPTDPSPSPDTVMPSNDGTGSPDSGSTPDAAPDSVSTPDAAPDSGSTPDAAPDSVSTPDAAPDAGPETSETIPAVLSVESQVLEAPYEAVVIASAALPSDATNDGSIYVRAFDGVAGQELLGSISIAPGELLENAVVTLDAPIVGYQDLVVEVVNGSGDVYLDPTGEPIQQSFEVTGDTDEAQVAIDSQQADPANYYGLVVDYVHVPERYKTGLWLAFYEDNNGAPGALRGKEKFAVGTSENTPVDLDTKLAEKRTLHALFRKGSAAGSWSSTSEVVTDFEGTVITTQFEVDSDTFHPYLEVEDQQLETVNVISQDVVIKKVTVPQNLPFLCIVLYTDVDGQPGEVLGYKQYKTGTTEDSLIELSVNQEGSKTLHALAFKGQYCSDSTNPPMLGVDGEQVKVVFKVGAPDLSYLLTPPITTTNPRFVTVERAYSYEKYAWVVLARDDNGQPGLILAQKRILPKYAGKVHFTQHSGGSGTECENGFPCFGQFLRAGSSAEYLTTNYPDGVTDPTFYRRTVRGDETLHVLLFEDDPQDGKFTYTPGGTEDVPVVDAQGQPIQSLLDVTVRSAIDNSQKDSSRYYWPCPLSNHYDNPTTLPVDCRCHTNIIGLDFPECDINIATYLNMQYGDGPRAVDQNFGRYRSGFADTTTNELIGFIVWKDYETVWPENQTTLDVGAVIAVDPETRHRRIISGRYKDPATGIYDVGDGPVLSYPFEIQKGPDGFYYVASYGYVRIDNSLTPTVDIIRVDPVSGDRSIVWRSNHLGYNFDNQPNPYGHCGNGFDAKFGYYSVQIGRKAFGLDEDGNFYLSAYHNGYDEKSYGISIIKIGADGSTCDFVTRTKTGANNVLYNGVDIGEGIEPQAGPYYGMLVKDGKIFTSSKLNGDLYEIDIATGDRTALYTEADGNISGGSGTHVLWDSSRNIIWQMGFSNAVRLYEPSTGEAADLNCPNYDRDYKGINCFQKAAWGNNGFLLERGGWLHPTDPNILFAVNGTAIIRFDMKSGNSDLFSF